VEITPHSLRRSIPILSTVVAALALLGFHPVLWNLKGNKTSPPWASLVEHVTLGFLLALGVSSALVTFRGGTGRIAGRLLGAWIAELFGWILASYIAATAAFGKHSELLVSVLSFSLFVIAIPGIWASALVRQADPSNPRALRFGRVFAGIAALGLVISAVESALSSVAMIRPQVLASLSSRIVLAFVDATVEKLLLLLAVVDTLRKSPNREKIVSRSRRIHLWMSAFMGISIAGLMAFHLMDGIPDSADEMNALWHGLTQQTIVVLVTAVAAVALENPKGSYKSSLPDHP
jgi:hypothetical protein